MSDPTIDAYPLSWPAQWPRTPRRQRSQFGTTFAAARDGIVRELALLGARDVIISSNVPLRRDGLPYASKGEADDPAVAVYFTLKGEQKCIPCDKWIRTRDNLQAIRKTIEALRGLDRWGAKEIVDAAFRGFAALPASTGGVSWWRVLGVESSASEVEIESAYRRLARTHHPDVGGDGEQFHQIAEAYRQAKGRKTA